MSFSVKSFIGLICFFAHFPAMGMDAPPIKIGVEIETSSIKTDIRGRNLGFIICNASKKELWAIEEDTLDQVFEKNPQWRKFNRNLEVKTVGGFDNKEFFLKKLETMTQVISRLYDDSLKESVKIDLNILGKIIYEIEKSDDLFIEFKDKEKKVKYFNIKSNPNTKIVNPQITYQLPLSKIPDLFKRLEMIGDKKIGDFLASLEDNFKKYKMKKIEKGSYFSTRFENQNNENGILNYFNDNFPIEIKKLRESVRGFSYLFLLYWKNIFNNNKLEKETEPGPKQFLPIMSRTPLSEIYDSLSEKEKEDFKKIFNDHIEKYGKQYVIREYYTFEGEKSNGQQLTLFDWYQSIINAKDRVRKEKKLTNGYANKYFFVDKLSPPPDLPDDYSMGFMIDSTKNPLMEGRSYARMSFHDKDIVIDNVKGFISEEAEWFFKEIS